MKKPSPRNGKRSAGRLTACPPVRSSIAERDRTPARLGRPSPVLITGGAGFIGTNLAHRLLSAGHPVIVFDNLARAGVERNLAWLRQQHGDLLRVEVADIRDIRRLRQAVGRAGQVFHFAAQVAVTTSLEDPFTDFAVNAHGTLNLLEAIRQQPHRPPLLFTSTNKVYGSLAEVSLRASASRYEPQNDALRAAGFDELRPLDFHSPYGCSKGAAEQYVLDYTRTFGLEAVVFRMSCIYGPHQFGTEDQGWVAHFLIQALEDRQITVYGDGRQVRDILFVDDLVQALLLAQRHISTLSGRAFNMGGGPKNTVSLLELVDHIGKLRGHAPEVQFQDWRPADQQYYVSDTRRFSQATGWSAQVPVREGIERLYRWLKEFRTAPVVQAMPDTALTGPNGAALVAKLRQSDFRARGGEPRSKRFWKEGSSEADGRKIIKFP